MRYSSVFWLGAVALVVSSSNALRAQESVPTQSGVDLKAIDKSVDPCTDFYQYACGDWIKSNPVPPEYAAWGRFNELQNRNLEVLHSILEDAEKHPNAAASDQKIGTLYGACMDEAAIEKAGYQPIEPGLQRISALTLKNELPAEVARLQDEGIPVFFRFGAGPDPDKSSVEIAQAGQGGLGLPDKSYYLNPKDEELRQKYVKHISRMLQLIGVPAADADAQAKDIMALETRLAQSSMDRVDMRNPDNTHHKMTIEQLQALTPDFNFHTYLVDRHAPEFTSLNVAQPDFYKGLNTALADTSLDTLKHYLTWHYLSSNASLLSKPFVDENFDFYNRTLSGTQQLQPRWKRCTQLVDRSLGEALGQKYVAKAFAGQSKQMTQQLVAMIEREMSVDIDSLTWMSAATKQQALAKLKGVTNKIGYPEKWRDYSSVKIVPGELVGDEGRARQFEIHRNLTKIGQPVDRGEFNMTPPTVNAYYSPLENNINFPAGILQPPFYTAAADMAVNFGGVGAVIGHELTHGFDDQGRRYDADGNLRDWWTQQDADEFKKRVDCIVNEYSGFSPVPGANINGRLTLGENGADNAGIRLAFMALLGGLEDGTINKEKLDGYTPQQRFFLGFAQIWCENQRPESLKNRIRTDPHSPGQFRVLGTVQNMPEFATAFGCKAGQPMVSANACRVW
ncbi:MAG TPA: M13 family metallopeptidase [Bryobacteraceae bacterium]|nr:M13 family metallopeptidase [Bryobacteraceae bacterium]